MIYLEFLEEWRVGVRGAEQIELGKSFIALRFHLKQGRKWLVSGMSQKNTELYLV